MHCSGSAKSGSLTHLGLYHGPTTILSSPVAESGYLQVQLTFFTHISTVHINYNQLLALEVKKIENSFNVSAISLMHN